ncbi:MAG: hypothetical protein ACFFFH_08470 [Candidatus Thorarchaeota archaeon]
MVEICYHIILSVSKNVTRDQISDILEKNNVDFIPIPCPDAITQKKKNDSCYSPFNRHCDCNTTLGAFLRQKDRFTKSKLKKMKKIYSSPEESKEEVQRQIEAWKELLVNDIETQRWISFLQDIFSKVWRINIVLHWQSDDPFIIKRLETRQHTEITSDLLLNIEEDVMYVFVKRVSYL